MQTLKTDTRKRILAVSRKLFLEKCFRGATTRDIARASGINLSNLYRYYSSKDDLFCALLKPATDALDGLLDERRGQGPSALADINVTPRRLWRLPPRGAGRSFESIYKRNRMTMKAILFV